MRIKRRRAVALLSIVGATASTTTASAAASWRTYTNERWGYRIDVPRSLVSQPEAENRGGLAILSTDGRIKLYTGISYNVDDAPISEAQRYAEYDWIGSTGWAHYLQGQR